MGYTGRQPGRAISVQRLSDPFVLSLQGDANGHVTIDASQDVTINTAVQDDSHNHVIGNVDGLQTTLDSKANTVTTVLKSSSTGAAYLPVGTNAQQPTGAQGMLRFNTDLNSFEGYNGTTWGAVGAGAKGGGSDQVFYENDINISVNYSITAGKNAMTAGPVTIADGVNVTIPDGSTWTIV